MEQDSFFPAAASAVPLAATRDRRLAGRKVVVVLESAGLELAQGKDRKLQLLNSFEHKQLMHALNRSGEEVRPDIVHQCLLALQESPLNRAGRLCVFVRTADRQLIEISPLLTVPSTYAEFSKLMTNLLYSRRLKAVERHNFTLAQIIKNETKNYLPVHPAALVALTASAERVVHLSDFAQQFREAEFPVVFFVGAVAHADPTATLGLGEECISIAPFGLTAAACCSSICAEFEHQWGIA